MQEILEAVLRRLADIKGRPILLAIDGDCAAGKSSLAAGIRASLECNVVHMDNFFLRPELRSDARLSTPGGNIDYERFLWEILIPLRLGRRIIYHPYDCSTLCFGEAITINPRPLTVVEGSYSLHPRLSWAYSYKIFLSVDPITQLRRIRERNGEEMAKRFADEWIPMEKRFFAAYDIAKSCDLRFFN